KDVDFKEGIRQQIKEAAKGLQVETTHYEEKSLRAITKEHDEKATADILIKNAIENIDEANPDWTFLASRLYLNELYQKAAENRGYKKREQYGDFYKLIHLLTEKGIYSPSLLDNYSEEDI